MASGIYEIRNTKNGRVYIGSTIDFSQRWNQHKQDLARGAHHSIKLQRAWVKYGAESFKFAILERVHNREVLLKIEQMWIDAENCVQKGYNVAAVAGYPGRADDRRCKDPSSIATSKGKNLSRQAQFPDENSKKRILDELVKRIEIKAEIRKWPANFRPKRVSRVALDHWVCGGCSVCHGVASFQWEDDDRVLQKIDCNACSGTGFEPIRRSKQEEEYIFDAIDTLDTLYREVFESTKQDCI